jgi:hypothetical protein
VSIADKIFLTNWLECAWRTIPEKAFHQVIRKPFKKKGRLKSGEQVVRVVRNASEIHLKTAGKKWFWQELAKLAYKDTNTGKVLGHLLGWHEKEAISFFRKFLQKKYTLRGRQE